MRRFLFFISLLLIFLTSCDQISSSNEPLNTADGEILTVHYIDANQADATLFQLKEDGETYNVLYDAGDWNRNDVVDYLHDLKVEKIDLVIISHPHADHIGQFPKIMNEFNVKEVWMSGNTLESNTFIKSIEAINNSEAAYAEPRAGETYEIGALTMEILHPKTLTGGLNEDSLSIRFQYGQMTFLFTGDAYKRQELEMVDAFKDIKATFLQLGHHGSNTSSDPKFLQAVDPEIAIYSAGVDNSYGHPHIEVIETLQDLDIPFYGTDMDGTIIVETNGKTYAIDTIETKITNQKKPKQCIDINQASKNELKEIIHIGEERVNELIEHRPYKNIDELQKINGIGKARVKDIKAEKKACVGG